MSQTYFTLITYAGLAQLADAAATGTKLGIEQMVVGDGGGQLPVPDPGQTQLVNECYRAPINSLSLDPKHPNRIIVEMVLPETVGGFWVRELGLINDDGILVAVANTPPSYKPEMAEGSGRTQLLRLIIVASDTALVELKVDPSVVMASQEFVHKAVDSALARLDLKQSVRAATVGPITLAGLQTVNGVALDAGDRVLVKVQDNAADNGLYAAAEGDWRRVSDADESHEVTPNLLVAVEEGATLADTLWQLVTDGAIELGTTPLTFAQVAGANGVAPGTYTKVSVDRRGLVVGGSNPTTLQGYGIDDAYTKAQTEQRLAIKADKATTLAAYGITDAYTKADVYNRSETDRLFSFKANLNQVYTRAQADQLLRDKANVNEVYNKGYVDGKLGDRPIRDSITIVGLGSGNLSAPYMRHDPSGQICWLQPQLGFIPVRQGGGHGQGNNTIYIGHGNSGPRITVDGTDFGDLLTDNNLAPKVAGLGLSGVGSYAFARLINPLVINQGAEVEGALLLYSSTKAADGFTNYSGRIGFGIWRCHGAASGVERTLWQRVR
ncbi:phage tail protein [Pseudomonas japonica]|uniref:phage tail protein n=1 Tax=Pseudomonas japonica TaxID=256466 RepID=UPI0015E27F6A|nr:phage tail protein [Pseudomonas japonica]MBA1289174.1 phage tail protein [Pseudomonas japonica]